MRPAGAKVMTEHNEQPTEDVLDRATAALRNTAIPDGPPAHLTASTVEALQSANPPDVVRLNERKRTMFRIMRYGSTAVAAALLVAIAGWLLLIGHSASLAFGDVIKNVTEAKSVSFVTKIPTIIQGTKRGVLQQKFHIEDGHYRMEIPGAQAGVPLPPDAPTNFLVMIADWKQKKALQLDYVHKTAKWLEPGEKAWEHMAKDLADPIKELRQLKEGDAERLADDDLDGHKVQVYHIKKRDVFMGLTQSKDETTKLWVDPKTGLPLRIAVGDPSNLEKPFFVFEQFKWNEPLDPVLFEMEIPSDFTVQ
jgi:hypothetical protein